MSTLSHRLTLRVSQKLALTPSLMQMVNLLQMNRLELSAEISTQLAENPVLEETFEADEATQEEIQALLERERIGDPADAGVLEMMGRETEEPEAEPAAAQREPSEPEAPAAAADTFDQIDFGQFFEEYLDPGFRTPSAENAERPSFETFLSSPITLADHLEQQLSLIVLTPAQREAAQAIIGNLDDNGYLSVPLEEIAQEASCPVQVAAEALRFVQSLDPAGIAARDPRECLLLQLESRGAEGGVAWRIVDRHLDLLQTKQFREIARLLGRPQEHIEIALRVIRQLDPYPGRRYTGPPPQNVEPDVAIVKEGDEYVIQLNDDGMPQLRLNPSYRKMLDRNVASDQEVKDARGYIRERYNSALQLLKNIEQRKQTILKVCQCVVARQGDMLDKGIDHLRPMMIKDVAEEIGVHPSTVSRAVAGKYADTPQGVFELRVFFSEAVQGAAGVETPLLVVKRKVRKMIEEEDPSHPLTDEQITARLNEEGILVTRRTVAKYREDMNIPSTHQRRVRP
jgi:RNA polymerase sigma-54 factor